MGKTAFEKAIEASYYSGELWKMATDEEILQGETPQDYTKTLVRVYADPEAKTILAGQAVARIKHIFADVAQGDEAELAIARSSLQTTFSTLERILKLPDPKDGYTTCFSNVQEPVSIVIRDIRSYAEQIGLQPVCS